MKYDSNTKFHLFLSLNNHFHGCLYFKMKLVHFFLFSNIKYFHAWFPGKNDSEKRSYFVIFVYTV